MEQIKLKRDELKTLLSISEQRRLLVCDAFQLVVAIMGPDPDKWPKTKAGMILRATKLIKEADELEEVLKKYADPEYFANAIKLREPDEQLIKKMLQP